MKTPLTYSDALDMAYAALHRYEQSEAVAQALLAVDQASRKQLLDDLKRVQYELDNDCPQHAAEIADKAILAADPASEPLDNVVARINAAAEKYLDGPGAFYEKRNRGGESGD